MNIEIRYCKPKDIQQLINLCAAHAKFEQADYVSENKEENLAKHLFAETSPLKCLVVENENELLGYASFMKQFSTWDAAFYILLDCLYLKPEARGNGIGNQIMKLISEYAKTENCPTIQWQTPCFNIKAIKFYQKLGARSKSKERFFWKV